MKYAVQTFWLAIVTGILVMYISFDRQMKQKM